MTKKRVNIDNFNQDATTVKLTSPRSIEACRRQGIIFEELAKIPFEQVEAEVRQKMKDQKTLSPAIKPKIPGAVKSLGGETY